MKKTKKKDIVLRSFSMDRSLGERLDEYSDETRIPKTAIVEMALEEYLDQHTKEPRRY